VKNRINKVKVFQLFVVNTLTILFIWMGVVYLYQEQYLIGTITIITGILLVAIGSSLKNKSRRIFKEEEDRKIIVRLKSEDEGYEGLMLSPNEGYLIGMPSVLTFLLISIASLVLLFHYDFRWYWSLPMAVLISILSQVLLFLLGFFSAGLINKTRLIKVND